METLTTILTTSATITAVGINLLLLMMSLRYALRYGWGWVRRSFTGEMEWHEIVYERRISRGESSNAKRQVAAITTLINGLGDKKWVRRGTVSFVIKKDYDDPQVRVFLGIDQRHNISGVVSTWARSMDCSAVPVDPIEIHPGALTLAFRERNNVGTITSEVDRSHIGNVMDNLQNLMSEKEESGESFSGSVILTVEYMRGSERTLTVANLGEEVIMGQGESALFSKSGVKGQELSSTVVRATIGVVNDSNDRSLSMSVLNTATSQMSESGMIFKSEPPEVYHRKFIAWWAWLMAFPILFASQQWVGMGVTVLTVITLTAVLASILGMSMMSSAWLAEDVRRGVILVPAFWRASPRRLLHGVWRKHFRSDAGGEKMGNRVAPPSCRQVLPLYQTPLLQFMSMPVSSARSTNIAVSRIPTNGIPRALEKKLLGYGNDKIFIGITPKNQPLFATVDDLEFGTAVGGDAGSGKSNSLLVHFFGMSMLSEAEDGRAKDLFINPIWLETKGEGAYSAFEMVEEMNPKFISVHDPNHDVRLAIEGPRYPEASPDEISRNVGNLVDGLISSYGDAIGAQSRDVAISALSIAMLLSKEEIEAIPELAALVWSEKPNIAMLVYLLVGADSSININAKLERLSNEIMTEAKNPAITQQMSAMEQERKALLSFSINRLLSLAKVRDALAPIQNKLSALKNSRGMFETSPNRRDIGFDEIIKGRDNGRGCPVIINVGPVRRDDGVFVRFVEQDMCRRYTTIIHHMLWQHIKANCAGWRARGRYVPLYADEVKDICGESKTSDGEGMNILQDVRDQGRGAGCSHNVGYQNFQQMNEDAAESVKSFVSSILLKFTNPNDIATALEQLGGADKTIYDAEVFRRFPQGVGAAVLLSAKETTDPCTIQIPYALDWKKIVMSSQDLDEAAERMIKIMHPNKRKQPAKTHNRHLSRRR